MLCCSSLQLRLEFAPVAEVKFVGFVAEKLSQVLGNLKVNLIGTELLSFTGERVCAMLCCASRIWDSGSVQCSQVAEMRQLLDL